MRTRSIASPTYVLCLTCNVLRGTAAINATSAIVGDGINANSYSDATDVNTSGASTPENEGTPSQPSDNSNGNSHIDIGNSGSGSQSSLQQDASIVNDPTTYYYNNNHNGNNQRVSAKYDDEQLDTYLDLFGEKAKELLTQHIIPSTDAECRWDWRMGRCEPYCICGFNFLWGDYHLGRSCRLRPGPPPMYDANNNEVSAEGNGNEETEETSWQDAWQEVWHSQMKEGTGAAEDDATDFVPPFFPKSSSQQHQQPSNDHVTAWDATSCTLPPESRYIQAIKQLSNTVTQSTAVVNKYQQLRNVTSHAVNSTRVHGRHHWILARQRACETVKRKVEERAQIRNQPVVLTRQGATWIRRVCGSTTTTASNNGNEHDVGSKRDGDGIDIRMEEHVIMDDTRMEDHVIRDDGDGMTMNDEQ